MPSRCGAASRAAAGRMWSVDSAATNSSFSKVAALRTSPLPTATLTLDTAH